MSKTRKEVFFHNLTLLKLNYCVDAVHIPQSRGHEVSGLNAKCFAT